MKIITIPLPEYSVSTEPDHPAVGKIVDDEIRKHFLGKTVIVRGISSSKHPDKSVETLVEIIQSTGTDKYDQDRVGDRYENIQNKHIDFFGFRKKVTPSMELFRHISWGFYHGSKKIHGQPERIDILMIYDASKVKAVVHQYEGRDDIKRDGFVFNDPENKKAALIGLVKIL
jgi:hypothetical protein